MKKLLALLLALVLVLSFAACGKTEPTEPEEPTEPTEPTEEPTEEPTDEPTDGPVAGGWTVNTEYTALTAPEDALEVFNTAMEGLDGVGYTPVAFLGTQVVAGLNYKFLCAGTTVAAEPVTNYYVIKIYKDLDGAVSLLDITALDVAALTEGEELTEGEALAGGWTVDTETGYTLPENAQKAFDTATEGSEVGYLPIACLGTQVVAGTNYAILVAVPGSAEEAPAQLGVMTVYADLSGAASILRVVAFAEE